MYLIKRQDGAFIPYDDSDHDESKKIAVGGVVKAAKERNYQHHKKAFALLNVGFHNQDKIGLFEPYRKVMTIKAGYYDTVKDKHNEAYYLPKSISYQNMNQEDFNKWYDDTMQVVAKDLGITIDELENEI